MPTPDRTAPPAADVIDTSKWSMKARFVDWRPHASWLTRFAKAYARITAPLSPEDEVEAWREIAIIFGDMGACEACLLVCLYGCALSSAKASAFRPHMNLCYLDMGLIRRARTGQHPVLESASAVDKPDPIRLWFDRELQPFGADPRTAAEFCLRLAAVRLGVLRGPGDPSFEQVLDASLWQKSPLG